MMLDRLPQLAAVFGALAAVVSVTLIVTAQVAAINAYEKRVAISKNEERAGVFMRVAERELRKLEAVSALIESESRDRSISQSAAQRVVRANAEILSAFYWGAGGLKPLGGGSLQLAPSVEAQVEGYAKSKAGKPFVSPPFQGVDGRAFLLFSDGTDDGARKGQSEAFLAIDPKVLVDHSEGALFEPGDLISLIGLDGITRARRTENSFSTGENLVGTLVMDRQLSDANGTYEGPNSITGEPSIFTHRRLSKYDVFATSGMTVKRIEGAAKRESRAYWIALVIFVIFSLVSLVVVLRNMARQRAQLAEANMHLWRLEQAQRLGRIGDWEFNPDNQTFLMSRGLIDTYAFGHGDGQDPITLEEFVDALSVPSARDFRGALYKALATGEPQYLEIEAIVGDEDARHREVTIGALQTNGDETRRLYGIDRDVSREKKLGAMRAKMSVLARLDALGALAATIAHELRQPLTAAKTFLAAGLRTLENGNVEQANTLFKNSMNQIQFTSDIVASASRDIRGTRGADQTFKVASAVDDVGELLRNFYENKSFNIIFASAPHAEIARGAHSQGKQIFFNLIKNSIEAMPPGQECSISIRTEALVQGMIGVWVQDNGTGLPEGAEPFTLFATTKEGGLGLGMSLTRTIVEGLGGEIRVDKTGPSGTVIFFTLVAAREDELAHH